MRTEEIFSKRLKSSMGKMTQRQLAAKVGTTEVTVSRWLNGSRIPRRIHLNDLPRAIG